MYDEDDEDHLNCDEKTLILHELLSKLLLAAIIVFLVFIVFKT